MLHRSPKRCSAPVGYATTDREVRPAREIDDPSRSSDDDLANSSRGRPLNSSRGRPYSIRNLPLAGGFDRRAKPFDPRFRRTGAGRDGDHAIRWHT
ncbi:hypothetical protein EA472_05430 [Natrarchaeobius oligotrophus]|uniref:Uncharacterized protein n=1 Tax=Natrarchaeobius chitinivorans TaxID=1679083 RepID=A0A3N6MCW3_NATCH|nr:hypothetical protein EA472_05430 [Natrarchaeobius chitinivorans]